MKSPKTLDSRSSASAKEQVVREQLQSVRSNLAIALFTSLLPSPPQHRVFDLYRMAQLNLRGHSLKHNWRGAQGKRGLQADEKKNVTKRNGGRCCKIEPATPRHVNEVLSR